jgi:xylulokinase
MEFSTQSVKMLVLDIDINKVVYTGLFDYDSTFPEYNTTGGILDLGKAELRHTSPFMMIEALDYAAATLKKSGINGGKIRAVKVDGMQHCSVYAAGMFASRLAKLDAGSTLCDQLKHIITRRTSPVWEDRSPVAEAVWLTEALRPAGGIEALTANLAELRFPASQVLKWAVESPEEYRATAHIMLLSAFMTSILAGTLAPVDTGDGWGTNLNSLDTANPSWSGIVLEAIDRYLQNNGITDPIVPKIGSITPYDTVIGRISPYFADKYGWNPEAVVLAGTGDNPATLLGCGGQAVVSLGTSFTVNGVMKKVVPSASGEYNVFGYTPGTAMALSVFTNGARVHDHFLRRHLKSSPTAGISVADWKKYARLSGDAIIKDHEPLMLPYLFDESVPLRKKGIVYDGFDESNAASGIRALHIAQALSLKLHSGHLQNVRSLCIVGGGAKNLLLKQLVADCFGAAVYTINNAAFAAPLGCAVSGARHLLGITYDEAAGIFVERDEASLLQPIDENRPVISRLLERYAELEKK